MDLIISKKLEAILDVFHPAWLFFSWPFKKGIKFEQYKKKTRTHTYTHNLPEWMNRFIDTKSGDKSVL